MNKILVVEDEPALQETLSYNLKREGYQVSVAGEGQQALKLARQLQPDLVILDLMLPGIDGFEITRVLRAEMRVPIIMLTARDDESDRVLGLEIGADDYITKPFSMRELLARVKAQLRRVQLEHREKNTPRAKELIFGDLTILPERHEALLGGEALSLKPKEYDLLVYLAEHRGRVLSRDTLMEQVWGWNFSGGSRTVDVHIRWLRQKIEPDPANPQRIITVRGAGYRFEG